MALLLLALFGLNFDVAKDKNKTKIICCFLKLMLFSRLRNFKYIRIIPIGEHTCIYLYIYKSSPRFTSVGGSFARYSEKCFAQIDRALYGDAMLVPTNMGTNMGTNMVAVM